MLPAIPPAAALDGAYEPVQARRIQELGPENGGKIILKSPERGGSISGIPNAADNRYGGNEAVGIEAEHVL